MKLQSLASSHVERGLQQLRPYSPAWDDGEEREGNVARNQGEERSREGREWREENGERKDAM